ncbi:MAG: hypothetical protein KJP07_09330 [Desulfatitalea sp.]|nr:hypothetical protein [Desulfatitalea sp.]
METGGMALRHDRAPDYFAFSKRQGKKDFCLVMGNKDRTIGGIASLSIRDYYVNRQKAKVAYLGDLRIHPRLYRRTRVNWRNLYVDLVNNYRNIRDFDNCEYFYTAILENNRSAINALTKGKSKFIYRELGVYQAVHILFRLPGFGMFRTARQVSNGIGAVRRAAQGDMAPLREFLYEQNKNKPFYDYITREGDDELERRCQAWDDFSISSFVIVENNDHEIIGCVSPWSHDAVRRLVLDKCSLKDRALSAILPIVGSSPLINGNTIHTLNLSHFEIKDNLDARVRKKVFRMLIEFIFSTRMHKGYHLISLLDYAGNSLGSILRNSGFITKTTRGVIYQVMSPDDMAEGHFIPTKEGICPHFELAVA